MGPVTPKLIYRLCCPSTHAPRGACLFGMMAQTYDLDWYSCNYISSLFLRVRPYTQNSYHIVQTNNFHASVTLVTLTTSSNHSLLTVFDKTGSEGVALPQHSTTNYCTLAGTVNKVSPPDFYCTDPDGSVDSCHDCTGDCLSPAAALRSCSQFSLHGGARRQSASDVV